MGFYHIVILLVVVYLCSFSTAVGPTKKNRKVAKPTSKQVPHVVSNDIPYADRSLAQWLSLTKETLTLICTNEHVNSRGGAPVLARRLYNHFTNFALTNDTVDITSPTSGTSPAPEITTNHNRNVSTSITIDPTVLSSSITDLIRREIQHAFNHNQPNSNSIVTTTQNIDLAPPIPQITTASSSVHQGGGQERRSYIQPDLFANQPPANNGFNIAPDFTNLAANSNTLGRNDIVNPLYQFNNNHFLPHKTSTFPANLPPPVQPTLAKKIQNGEFINFDLLLPQSTPASSPNDFAIRIQQGDAYDGTALSLVPRSQTRSKIFDFYTWLLAWNNFMRTYVQAYPLLTPQLLYYQSMICQYANQYVFEDVYTFDRNYRMRLANNNNLRWDRHDLELVAKFLHTHKQVCFKCKNFGHYSSACPLTTTSSSAVSSHALTPSNDLNQPFPAPQRSAGINSYRFSSNTQHSRPVHCYYFNQFGRCDNRRCTYPHTCASCSGDHAKSHCPSRLKR